jgi:hypothetical protein
VPNGYATNAVPYSSDRNASGSYRGPTYASPAYVYDAYGTPVQVSGSYGTPIYGYTNDGVPVYSRPTQSFAQWRGEQLAEANRLIATGERARLNGQTSTARRYFQQAQRIRDAVAALP